jgi:aryl-alcohol dehydrogenase-like predicted oxidoreductase
MTDSDFRRKTHPRFQPENLTKNLQIVEKVEKLATEKGCTPAQLALAWVLAQGPDVVPIPGTKKVHYLRENIQATSIKLTAEEVRRIGESLPKGIAAGERYAAAQMQRLGR